MASKMTVRRRPTQPTMAVPRCRGRRARRRAGCIQLLHQQTFAANGVESSNQKTRGSLSGGIDRRPVWEQIVSKWSDISVDASPTLLRILRSGCRFGIRSSRDTQLQRPVYCSSLPRIRESPPCGRGLFNRGVYPVAFSNLMPKTPHLTHGSFQPSILPFANRVRLNWLLARMSHLLCICSRRRACFLPLDTSDLPFPQPQSNRNWRI